MSDPSITPSPRSTHERRWLIVQEVQEHQQASVAELSRRLGVSAVAIRRDLEHLERAGLLRRVHGGAVAVEQRTQLSPFEARRLQNTAVKQALGRAAAELIRPGDTVFLDSGTTVLEIARHLPKLLPEGATLTVLTRSLSLAYELRSERRIRLIVLGGVYVHDFDTFVGAQVEQALQEIHADLLCIGTDGVSPEHGLTTDNVLEAGLYRIMAQRAQRVAVVTDSSKIGANKVQSTLPFSAIHIFITDSRAPEAFTRMLRERGCEVIVVHSDYPTNHGGFSHVRSQLGQG